MRAAITGYDVLTCLGDAEETYRSVCRGDRGVGPLRRDTERLGVSSGYQIDDPDPAYRAGRWLTRVIAGAAASAGLGTHSPGKHSATNHGAGGHSASNSDASNHSAGRNDADDPGAGQPSADGHGAGDRGANIAVIVGTGLRQLPDAERWWLDSSPANGGPANSSPMNAADLHFGSAARAALPGVGEVLTISNACAASGYALALGQDMLAAGEADVVVVAGCDSMTDSLLACIGRGSPGRSSALRPFEADREGVLLGEGAAAVVLESEESALRRGQQVHGLLYDVGLTCDAFHETAPDPAGIADCMRQAHDRAGVKPEDISLVIAHGTGTALNDPAEATALTEVLGEVAGQPAVTGIKGSIGHTSGGSALMSLVVGLQAMRDGLIPPIAGLDNPIPETDQLRLVAGEPERARPDVIQVDAFGFGGVNAVALIGASR